ncbi:MAG: aldo/keto reductase [Solobacterium sp.]|nr:aldo/keto reductase [Solobacterium sp.]
MSDYFGSDTFKLGFGLMRLPRLEDGSTDIEQIKQMVDRFLEAGGTYFDTAYVYGNDGDSETAVKEALIKRHPRDHYTIATKLNALLQAHDEDSAKAQFYTSLERTGAGYFDYYLLHALQAQSIHLYEDYRLWDFVKEQKEKGLIRHLGFSFHATPELLDQVLTAHPDVDFVQLQINYADWNNPNVQSRRCYEVARKHNKSIVVMEPVKGGGLANPNPSVQKILKDAAPDLSFASWAIRYVASMDGILTVLSGMSNLSQMEDNLSYMEHFQPLSEAEQAVIQKAQAALADGNEIACTSCHYCTKGCPMNIAIPEIFASLNEYRRYHNRIHFPRNYAIATSNGGSASDCIQCGQCEGACPQHLSIIRYLKDVTAELDTLR